MVSYFDWNPFCSARQSIVSKRRHIYWLGLEGCRHKWQIRKCTNTYREIFKCYEDSTNFGVFVEIPDAWLMVILTDESGNFIRRIELLVGNLYWSFPKLAFLWTLCYEMCAFFLIKIHIAHKCIRRDKSLRDIFILPFRTRSCKSN